MSFPHQRKRTPGEIADAKRATIERKEAMMTTRQHARETNGSFAPSETKPLRSEKHASQLASEIVGEDATAYDVTSDMPENAALLAENAKLRTLLTVQRDGALGVLRVIEAETHRPSYNEVVYRDIANSVRAHSATAFRRIEAEIRAALTSPQGDTTAKPLAVTKSCKTCGEPLDSSHGWCEPCGRCVTPDGPATHCAQCGAALAGGAK